MVYDPQGVADLLANDPTMQGGRIDFGNLGAATGFGTTARAGLNASLFGQERAAKQAAMDDTSRFNTALGAAQAAIIGKQKQQFADQAVQGGLNIGLQTAQADQQGRLAQAGYQQQSNESGLQRLNDRYLSSISLGQRNNELSLMQQQAQRQEMLNMLSGLLSMSAKGMGAAV